MMGVPLRLAVLAGVLALVGCDGPSEPHGLDAGRAARGLGETCSRSEDCASSLCIAVGAGRNVCTEPCAADGDCPADGWGCVRPEGLAATVCGCAADAPSEVCGDGVDNDCDGRADDCRICDGRAVPDDDPRHCGACGHACGADEECHAGECRCADASAIACPDGCVDVDRDSLNCGSCGNVCSAGQVCTLGECQCPAGTTACDGRCVDTTSSLTNCGACGRACVGAESCVDGACLCPTGQTSCEGRCVDLSTASTDCGVCGRACRGDEQCTAGACDCVAGEECGGACVDTLVDVENCGACGTVCRGDERCSSGACECIAGRDCGGACVDTRVDLANCGVCGRACVPGETCWSGSCLCASGLHCGGSCVAADDRSNCGACGNVCSAATVCSAGRCVCPVPGQIECDGVCIDPRTNAEHCGSCGNACDSRLVCAGGACDCPGAADSFCSDAGCVALATDESNCGSCGLECAPLQVCGGGGCSCPSAVPNVCPGVGCVDFRTDELHCGTCTNACRPTEECTSYSCRCPSTGERWCASAGACIDTLADPANCGACDRACPVDAACSTGTCRCGTAGETVCGTDCVDLTTDAEHCGSCTRSCTGSQICGAGTCTCVPATTGPEARVSTGIGSSYDVRIAWNGSRGLLVWSDSRLSPRGTVWGQFVNDDGSLVGAEFQISPTSFTYSAHDADVVWTGTEWGVSYASYNADRVYVVRLAPDGTPLAPPASSAPDGTVRLGFNSTIGYFYLRDGGELGFRALGPDATTPGPLNLFYRPPCCPEGRVDVAMAVAPTGEIGVTRSIQNTTLFFVLSPSGVAASPIALTTSNANATSLAHDGTTWVAAWLELASSTDRIVVVRGDALGSRLTVATAPGWSLFLNPRIAVRGRELVVSWRSRATMSSPWQIYGRRLLLPLTSTGAPTALEAPFQLVGSSTFESDYMAMHEIIGTPAGLLVSWSDTRWGQTEIYEQAVLLPPCAP